MRGAPGRYGRMGDQRFRRQHFLRPVLRVRALDGSPSRPSGPSRPGRARSSPANRRKSSSPCSRGRSPSWPRSSLSSSRWSRPAAEAPRVSCPAVARQIRMRSRSPARSWRAWRAGDLSQAARYTDHPAAAQAALVTYRKYLHLRKLTATVPERHGGVRERGRGKRPGTRSTPRWRRRTRATALERYLEATRHRWLPTKQQSPGSAPGRPPPLAAPPPADHGPGRRGE